MVGHGDERLVFAVGDVEPPPLLLLLWEVQAVSRMRHLGLGLQQRSLPPLDALLQRLPLLTWTRGEQPVSTCLTTLRERLSLEEVARRDCFESSRTSSSSPAISSTSVSLCLSLSSSLSLGESLLASPSSDSLPLSEASSSSSFTVAAAASWRATPRSEQIF